MGLRLLLVAVLVVALGGLLTGGASAAAGSETYQLVLEVPNVSEAPNGDRIAVTGEGMFSVQPKSVSASGTFTHTDSQGNVVGTGTWTATDMLSFQLYGCGIVHNFPTPGATTPLPPNFCGGMLKLRVLLTAGSMQHEGYLTVFCIVGENPPDSHDDPTGEGVHLVVPGINNFNKIVTGMNIYIRTS
jgi:hypothetical protein